MKKSVKISVITKASVIREINAAIIELREARRFVVLNNFESAENEIGDSVRILGRVIRNINSLE